MAASTTDATKNRNIAIRFIGVRKVNAVPTMTTAPDHDHRLPSGAPTRACVPDVPPRASAGRPR
jgi:hypothetical protein